jgi:hypothetical protein
MDQPIAAEEPGFLHDLSLVEARAWSLLERGVRDRRSPFHAPNVATLSADGPQVRTVTLRHADRATASVRFNADARGGLVQQLGDDPRASMHAYGVAEKTQLRLRARAVIHRMDEMAAAAWRTTALSAKRCYLVPQPGSPSAHPSSGLPALLERRAPTVAETEQVYSLFCVVELKIDRIEWLYLHAIHKRRARFSLIDGRWTSQWLTP